jgi:hypothetical protein
MFRILSDIEVALNELLVACRESVDHYEENIERINGSEEAARLRTIVSRRKLLLGKLALAIRALGDLPTMPDPDKETGEMLIEQVGASLSNNDTGYIIAHRIKAEHQIQTLINDAKDIEMEDTHRALLQELARHIGETIQELSSPLARE